MTSNSNGELSSSTLDHRQAVSNILQSSQTLGSYISRFADWKYHNPILAFPRNSYADFELFSAREINTLSDKAAAQLIAQGIRQIPEEESVTVALFATGSAAYAAAVFALAKLGYSIFLLSPRLPLSVVVALLVNTHCHVVLYSADMKDKLKDVMTGENLKCIPMASRDELESDHLSGPVIYDDAIWCKSSKVAIIWHSSGSTGIPKTFSMSQDDIMARIKSVAASPTTGVSLFITSAVYNPAGSTFLLSALTNSATSYFYNDQLPYTGDGLTQVLVQARPKIFNVVPYALAQLASTPSGCEALKLCQSVNVFGALCPTELGNELVKNGINLSSGYSLTETSRLMTSALRNPRLDKAWDYMTPFPSTKQSLWMKPLDGELFECVILPGLANCPLSNSNDPPGSFHTSDIFMKHPTLPDRWKIIGRRDDMINMSFSGGTFMAGPLEEHVKSHPYVDEAVIFGNGRPKLGMLIFWREAAQNLPEDMLLAEIWPRIVELNAQQQESMRLSRGMIISIPVGDTWPRTDKQNLVRPRAYRQYENLINAKYAALEEC